MEKPSSASIRSIPSPPPVVLRDLHRHVLRSKNPLSSDQYDSVNPRYSTMASFLYRRIAAQGWIQQPDNAHSAFNSSGVCGVVIRVDGGDEFIVEPSNAYSELTAICRRLNLNAVFAMRTELSDLAFQHVTDETNEINLHPYQTTVPVAHSLHDVATTDTGVRRRDFGCFIRKEQIVLIWAQAADDLINAGSTLESKMMGSIWGSTLHNIRDIIPPMQHSRNHSHLGSIFSEKMGSVVFDQTPSADNQSLNLDAEDEEALKIPPRPFVLSHSIMIGMAMCLLLVVESLAIRQIIVEIHMLGVGALDRLALIVTLPIFMFMGMFIFTVIFGCVFQGIGPIQDIKAGNTRFFSSRPPDRRRHPDMQWPHITIQMPVYKEGLKGVIIPTINSLLPAIAHYEKLGGTASIYVCEDGMQAVKPEIAEMRQKFYKANNIGWCARPPHNKVGFIRGGRFKKASNMNYALNFSLRVEDELLRRLTAKAEEMQCNVEDLSIEDENELYEQAMETVILSDEGRTMAAGNVRMGEVILLIDCDTRVPVDCLSLAAMEMEESPEVAIIQHASGVMQVTHSFFENAITYFTNLVYLLIRFSVGNGDYAPFVGHNAFLRWKALQSVCFTAEDGRELFWSESHVSEDFDMSLRLQTAGFVVRLATYDNGEFKEGVSLTVFDELLRWEKYAYGCSELLFNPVYTWLWRGPFTSLFRRFLWSNMKISSKFTILGYIGTYYSIAAALPLSLANYLLTGWIADDLDHAYMNSWNVLAGQLVIFIGVSPLLFAWYRHRIENEKFWWALLEGWKWLPFFVVFFGGLSWHLAYALLAHMFCLRIEWSSTAKELESTGFFISLENVLKTFKWVLCFSIPVAVGMLYLAQFAPVGWTIDSWTSIVPLANQIGGHIGLPLLSILL